MAEIVKKNNENEVITSQSADFINNLKMIESTLFSSKSFEHIKDSGLDRDAQAQIIAEIFKQAVAGAVQMSELDAKLKSQAFELKKMQTELELAILTAKAQVKLAKAQATKELVQCQSMIRSVSDNAAINLANGYIAYGNVMGSATTSTILTQKASSGGTIEVNGLSSQTYSYTDLVLKTLSLINVEPIKDFDNEMKKLINMDDDFGCKEVLILATKSVLFLGEVLEIVGVSSLGENATQFIITDADGSVQTLNNLKSFNFFAKNAGDVKIEFKVENGETNGVKQYLSDSLMLKVIDKKLLINNNSIKKF